MRHERDLRLTRHQGVLLFDWDGFGLKKSCLKHRKEYLVMLFLILRKAIQQEECSVFWMQELRQSPIFW